MWIFTENGFVSIVQDAQREGYLLVRSRVRSDVEWFVSSCQEIFKCKVPGGVRETHDTDYRFRASIPAAVIGELIGALVSGIDYTNFKDRAHDVDPDPDRGQAYLQVWMAMNRFQLLKLPFKKLRSKINKLKAWRA